MTPAEKDTLADAPPSDRSAYRNLFIYNSADPDTMLGGLWVAEGITNNNLYSMVEILCVFTDDFNLRDDNQRLVGRDEQPLQPGNYYIVTTGRSPLRFGHNSAHSKWVPSLSPRKPLYFVRSRCHLDPGFNPFITLYVTGICDALSPAHQE